jgi:hypothetical protein
MYFHEVITSRHYSDVIAQLHAMAEFTLHKRAKFPLYTGMDEPFLISKTFQVEVGLNSHPPYIYKLFFLLLKTLSSCNTRASHILS